MPESKSYPLKILYYKDIYDREDNKIDGLDTQVRVSEEDIRAAKKAIKEDWSAYPRVFYYNAIANNLRDLYHTEIMLVLEITEGIKCKPDEWLLQGNELIEAIRRIADEEPQELIN